MDAFEFLNTDNITDGEITLALIEHREAMPAKGFVPSYVFAICKAATGEPVGAIDLRIGYNDLLYYGGHIGYHVDPAHRGHRYAAKACGLLFGLARRHGMQALIITCNPDNMASRRTIEYAGGVLREIADLPEDNDMYASGERRKCIYDITL